jgi:hypothetical protein
MLDDTCRLVDCINQTKSHNSIGNGCTVTDADV